VRPLALLALLSFPALASAQAQPAYLFWKYDDQPELLYALRNVQPQLPGQDFLQAESAWIIVDPLSDPPVSLFDPPITSEFWDNGLTRFNFTTVAGQQGGGDVIGSSDTEPEWAAGLPDKYDPDFFPATGKKSTRKK